MEGEQLWNSQFINLNIEQCLMRMMKANMLGTTARINIKLVRHSVTLCDPICKRLEYVRCVLNNTQNGITISASNMIKLFLYIL